ncbi:MAG: hypothetical protein WD800_05815, partial [Dehalococcoidia bacterium]
MARAKTRRARATSRSSANSVPDILSVGRFLVRPEIAGTALVVLAVAAVPYVIPITGIVGDLRDRLVQALGLHVFTLVVLVAVTGIVLALRQGHLLLGHARHVAGLAAVLVLLAGVFGRWYPQAAVGSVEFEVVSAGGDAGRALTSGAIVTGAWLAMLPLGFALLWPRTALQIARNSPRWTWETVRWLWDLGLHRR